MAKCNSPALSCRPGTRLWRSLIAAASQMACVAALAQPLAPVDLRREIEKLQAENQRLATQVGDLTDRLHTAEAARDEAIQRADALAAELERLRQGQPPESGPGQAASPPSPDATSPAPIPADSMASPASLLAELQRRYLDSFPTEPDDAGTKPPVLSASARRALESWCVEQSRSLRGAIRWHVRFTSLRPLARNERSVLLTVLDPESGRPIGQTLEIAVPRQFGDRLARELGPTGGDEKAPTWILVATMTARPSLNPQRPTPGVFNHPAFVGPYVEFGFDLHWESATPVSPSRQGVAPDEG